MRTLPILIALLLPAMAGATSWNEPWHADVVRQADTFFLGKVKACEKTKLTLTVSKHLAGAEVAGDVVVNGYYALRLTSQSVDETSFRWRAGWTGYVFLKRNEDKASYTIASPTAGWAKLDDGVVTATFRISCHKGLVKQAPYEAASIGLFNALHGKPVDEDLLTWIEGQLAKPPAVPTAVQGEVAERFFHQHVALELLAYVGREPDLTRVKPFLAVGADGFGQHVQIGAARALGGIEGGAELLIDFVEREGASPLAKWMALRGLERHDARRFAERLTAYAARPAAAKEEPGFGLNLMDPRIGTHTPGSVKDAIDALMKRWKAAGEGKAPAKPDEQKGE